MITQWLTDTIGVSLYFWNCIVGGIVFAITIAGVIALFYWMATKEK